MEKETALKILRERYAKALFSERTALETLIPELAESEDERIRKEIKKDAEVWYKEHYEGSNPQGRSIVIGAYIDGALAWLEKQNEPQDKGEISDGYHTFNELYYYRMLYNAAFFNMLPKEWVHKSKRHNDGEECFGGGWFIVIANLPTGQISNHYELKDWDLFQIPEKEVADKWDGHTPQEAADRLHKYLLEKQGEPAKLSEEEQNRFAKGVLTSCALSFMTYLDTHRYEGKMCLSNKECEDIENALYNSMWDRLHRYYCKYIEKQGEQGNQHLYDVIIALWNLLDKIDTFADLQIDDTDLDNPFRKIEHITGERHKFVKSDGYNLYIKGEKITDFQEQNTMMYNSTEESKCEENDSSTVCLEKQGEQKLTDNVEPILKIGDWIINNDERIAIPIQILKIEKYGYITSSGYTSFDKVKRDYHLWTIQDAKDGDVLTIGNEYFLFKAKKENTLPVVYIPHCFVSAGAFRVTNGRNCGEFLSIEHGVKACPATKEQRDILFAKMKEAGYKWDAEKKELKKIEQNPAWSKEDELNLKQAIYVCHQNGYTAVENWLKSLKPQQNKYDKGFNDGYSAAEYNQWKPSEKQMKALKNTVVGTRGPLYELYFDLTKL